MSVMPHGRIVLLVTVGTSFGALIGSAVTWWLVKRDLCDRIARLLDEVSRLARQVDGLCKAIECKKDRKYEFVSSIEEDADVYEDAYGGPVSWVGGLNSDQVSCMSDSAHSDAQLLLNNIHTSSLYSRVDRLLEGTDEDKRDAFEELLSNNDKLENDADFLWRLSKATYFMSQLETFRDKSKQKVLVYQALDFASRALELDDCNANVHKWYAITLGSTGDYESISTKIQNGYKFKVHIEKTIQLNPNDPSGHYLLGRWCFGVYMLSWVERKMAATLFAAPPTATVDEALDHFMEADRLNPGRWKENLLFIAKCYVQKRDYVNAVTWLNKANEVPVRSTDDETHHNEVTSLLQQYSSYQR